MSPKPDLRRKADPERAKVGWLRGLFGRGQADAPATASAPASRDRRSDFMVAALGVTLGLICALFPWYIFFNQDKFGVRAIRFGDNPTEQAGPITLYPQPDRIGEPMDTAELPAT
ncbi:MAG: hypothetical protein JNL61_04155, partial [Rhizobiaceae bacterium]|nr:hypothetical protein [Rhizobiaceae bacterium]